MSLVYKNVTQELPEARRVNSREVFLVLVDLTVDCRHHCPVGSCRNCAIGDNVVLILVVDKFLVVVRAHCCAERVGEVVDRRGEKAKQEKEEVEVKEQHTKMWRYPNAAR